MHPTVLQDGKGDCPICGMKLVPVADARAGAVPAGVVAAGAGQRKALGIAVEPVRRAGGTRTLRLPGRVVPDEARVYRVDAGVEGSIRDLSAVNTGSRVRKDQVLGSYYAPGTLSVIQLYLLASGGLERAKALRDAGTPAGESVALGNSNLQQRIQQLENFGVSALQREEMLRDREIPDTIKIVSPADGFVLARNVAPGLRFERGHEFYRIADLRRVWIVADAFPQDADLLRPGMRGRIAFPEQPGEREARVTEILPQVDSLSRTLKVRLELDNPGYRLRPDMLVDVRFDLALPPALVAPTDAVVDAGLRKTVFVERDEGRFEPREVRTGWREAGLIEIVDGLSPGERIVTSGTFFLDSESRMRAADSGAAASRPTPDPTGNEDRSSGGAGNNPPARSRAHARGAAQGRAGELR